MVKGTLYPGKASRNRGGRASKRRIDHIRTNERDVGVLKFRRNERGRERGRGVLALSVTKVGRRILKRDLLFSNERLINMYALFKCTPLTIHRGMAPESSVPDARGPVTSINKPGDLV